MIKLFTGQFLVNKWNTVPLIGKQKFPALFCNVNNLIQVCLATSTI